MVRTLPYLANINRVFLIGLLSLIVMATFFQVVHHEFILIDDDLHINNNPVLTQPSLKKIFYLWKEPYQGLYIPVTYSVWAIQKSIAETLYSPKEDKNKSAWIYHLANLFCHLINAVLVFIILQRLIRINWAAFGGALLFALHPLQVEPIAWVSGFKDCFSSLLALLSILFYTVFSQRSSIRQWTKQGVLLYVTAILFFVLALLAKPSTVALPVIAFALDRWLIKQPLKNSLLALGPWLILCIPIAIITKHMQPPFFMEFVAPLWIRPLIAGDAITFYLSKLIFPLHLAPDYSRTPENIIDSSWIYVSWLGPICLLLLMPKKPGWWKASIIIFMAGLLPVLGFVPFFFQAFSTVADRYLYLAMLGPALATAYFLSHYKMKHAFIVIALLTLGLSFLSYRQIGFWKNSKALFTHNIRVNPNSLLAHNNLGTVWDKEAKWVEAIYHYEEAKRVSPKSPAPHYNLGRVYAKLFKFDKAIAYFENVIGFQPSVAEAHYSLGLIYANQKDYPKALRSLKEALHHRPYMANANELMGFVHKKKKQFSKAIPFYRRALRFNPKSYKIHQGLGECFKKLGKDKEADRHFRVASRLAPKKA